MITEKPVVNSNLYDKRNLVHFQLEADVKWLMNKVKSFANEIVTKVIKATTGKIKQLEVGEIRMVAQTDDPEYGYNRNIYGVGGIQATNVHTHNLRTSGLVTIENTTPESLIDISAPARLWTVEQFGWNGATVDPNIMSQVEITGKNDDTQIWSRSWYGELDNKINGENLPIKDSTTGDNRNIKTYIDDSIEAALTSSFFFQGYISTDLTLVPPQTLNPVYLVNSNFGIEMFGGTVPAVNSVIQSGSTIKAGSTLNGSLYDVDIILGSDLTVLIDDNLIYPESILKANSVLEQGSTLNGNTLDNNLTITIDTTIIALSPQPPPNNKTAFMQLGDGFYIWEWNPDNVTGNWVLTDDQQKLDFSFGEWGIWLNHNQGRPGDTTDSHIEWYSLPQSNTNNTWNRIDQSIDMSLYRTKQEQDIIDQGQIHRSDLGSTERIITNVENEDLELGQNLKVTYSNINGTSPGSTGINRFQFRGRNGINVSTLGSTNSQTNYGIEVDGNPDDFVCPNQEELNLKTHTYTYTYSEFEQHYQQGTLPQNSWISVPVSSGGDTPVSDVVPTVIGENIVLRADMEFSYGTYENGQIEFHNQHRRSDQSTPLIIQDYYLTTDPQSDLVIYTDPENENAFILSDTNLGQTWGHIVGEISNQQDLHSILDHPVVNNIVGSNVGVWGTTQPLTITRVSSFETPGTPIQQTINFGVSGFLSIKSVSEGNETTIQIKTPDLPSLQPYDEEKYFLNYDQNDGYKWETLNGDQFFPPFDVDIEGNPLNPVKKYGLQIEYEAGNGWVKKWSEIKGDEE